MSNIEWTEKTWNPVVGCTPVSPGCLNCYAATMARRLEAMGQKDYQPKHELGTPYDSGTIRIAEVKNGRAVFTGDVRCLPDRLHEPLRRKKPTTWFVNSMSDLFHEAVPFDFICQVFATMFSAPQHIFQVLTKRPERMRECLSHPDFRETMLMHAGWGGPIEWPLPNVWLGASVEDQPRADERIPHLLRCPAAVQFLSCEPLLGAINFMNADGDGWRGGMRGAIHWVIVGGESGPNARPCDVAWIRSIVNQCKGSGVPCFVKQLGSVPRIHTSPEHTSFPNDVKTLMKNGGYLVCLNDRKGGDMAEWPEDLRVREMPAAARRQT
jgi:protein gp37